MIRRIAGVAISALLLQFNLVPREIGCVDHARHQAEPASQVPTSTESAHHDHQSTEQGAPCTSDTDCCEALGACSASCAIGSARAETSSAIANRALSVFRATPPAYLIRAPELPPPKA